MVKNMKKITDELDNLISIAKSVAHQFGIKCEVLIHDYERPFESSIVYIENSHVTQRKIGNGGTDIGLRVFNGKENDEGRYSYLTRTQDGKLLRSSTAYIKNDEQTVIGTLCINFDITELMMASNFLDDFVNVGEKRAEEIKPETTVYNEVDDLLENLINQSIDFVGIPVSHMTREQKIEGIKFLEKKGAFFIKKATGKISTYYDISKYTIYNYLNEQD